MIISRQLLLLDKYQREREGGRERESKQISIINIKPITNAINLTYLSTRHLHTCIITIYTFSENYKRHETKDKSKAATDQHIIKMTQTCHKIHKPVVSRTKSETVKDTKISLKIETYKINMKCMWWCDIIWCMSGLR